MTDNKDNIHDLYNEDELKSPMWLNDEFITKVLRDYENDAELKVVSLKNLPASAKGDHYASVMFRTEVEYKRGNETFTKSLIVKSMPEEEGHKKEMLSGSNIFETEIGIYSRVLPEFEKILQAAGDKTKLFVPCIYHSVEPRTVLIMDDLLPMGYSVIRERDATEKELQLAYTKLAKWHAVSMKIQNEQPEFLEDYNRGLFDLPHISKDPFIIDAMIPFLAMFDKVPELSKYKPYFEKIKGVYLKRLKDVMVEYRVNRRQDTYYVLSHGDYHLRNMLFKPNKNSGALEDVMLVDFQISNLCPITIDLIYSIYLLMGPEQRSNDWRNLLNYYFTTLLETLQKIDYKAELPTLDGFWQQIYRHKYFDFFMICTFLPLVWAVRSKNFEATNILQNADDRSKCYLLDGYIEDLKILLPRFESMGYFDDL
ncbi:uncharacterized protein LOC111519399 [Drosophila willistoni]|uniref:uncharacterized protein LOC111519399 n=1 Tax=Drosophila willistoni TaxID=7260 RepID=UPI000C26CDF9|nr:uncharacterized protein LOC111519399 [Drosophila willistoni]